MAALDVSVRLYLLITCVFWGWDADSLGCHTLPGSLLRKQLGFCCFPHLWEKQPWAQRLGRSVFPVCQGRNASMGNSSCQWELCDPSLWHKTCVSWCSLLSLDIIKTILAFCPVTALDAALWDRSCCLFMHGSYLSLPASVSCSWFLTSPPAFCFPPNVSSTLSFLSSPFYTSWASSSSCSSYL